MDASDKNNRTAKRLINVAVGATAFVNTDIIPELAEPLFQTREDP